MLDPVPTFDMPDLGQHLATVTEADLDDLDFGVIGFDDETTVCRYNALESAAAGLSQQRVVGQPLFTNVAPCMNNFMVAQRFEDAREQSALLDTTIDYVLTLRMRPVKVALRLIAVPGAAVRYVLVRRQK
jgi:photoactive yellow protein